MPICEKGKTIQDVNILRNHMHASFAQAGAKFKACLRHGSPSGDHVTDSYESNSGWEFSTIGFGTTATATRI
jgi:hypothetical protein